jgi:hypothetical protein
MKFLSGIPVLKFIDTHRFNFLMCPLLLRHYFTYSPPRPMAVQGPCSLWLTYRVVVSHSSYEPIFQFLCLDNDIFRSTLFLDTLCHKVIRRLTTGIRSEKCVVRRFRRCANVYLQNLDSIACYTLRLRPVAPRLQTCTACYCTEYCRQL